MEDHRGNRGINVGDTLTIKEAWEKEVWEAVEATPEWNDYVELCKYLGRIYNV